MQRWAAVACIAVLVAGALAGYWMYLTNQPRTIVRIEGVARNHERVWNVKVEDTSDDMQRASLKARLAAYYLEEPDPQDKLIGTAGARAAPPGR